jgi:uncharacterized membrane protein YgaE (UPF0421/DUF939 family)
LLHQRAQLAVKAALAATLSWVLADLISGELASYRYYAPLGAVVATYPTVASSLRTSLRAAASVAVGGALGLAVQATMQPSLLSLALVIAVGTMLGALPFLGEMRSYVPIVALFVLVIGGSNPGTYAAAYTGLMLLGGLCGVAVSLLMPALRLTQSQDAVQGLRRLLAEQLDELADALWADEPPDPEDWQHRVLAVAPQVDRMRAGVLEAVDARRGNPRARFHHREVDRQRRLGRTLEQLAPRVENLTSLLVESYRQDLPASPLDHELAVTAAEAVADLAELVRHYRPDMDADDERLQAVRESIARLTAAYGERRDLEPADAAGLGAVVAALRRCLGCLTPS